MPKENAFCLVAPTLRFSAFAIFSARVLLLAIVFSVRTFSAVQARRLVPFFIRHSQNRREASGYMLAPAMSTCLMIYSPLSASIDNQIVSFGLPVCPIQNKSKLRGYFVRSSGPFSVTRTMSESRLRDLLIHSSYNAAHRSSAK